MSGETSLNNALFFYGYFPERARGYFSEYRYDALGRRVLVRTRRDGLCNTSQSTVDCTSGIERFVWAGDNILWEMRGPGGNTETADRLEREYATPQEYGIVGYTHAGGVDRPLVAYKTLGGNAGAVVVPHMNWRGLFSMGTAPSGASSPTLVEWPGFRTTATHAMGETQALTTNWMGSLLEGQRDAGGQMYMRNRYYDPATGQFTQTDPIGIAGGLNTYGFAAGDPVSYSDPYGLCPPDDTNQDDCQKDEDGNLKDAYCPAGMRGTPPNCVGEDGTAVPFSCPNVTPQEWDLGQEAIRLTIENGLRFEEGFAITDDAVIPMRGSAFVRQGSSIEPRDGIWPLGTHSMVHSHPSGRGISPGDIGATNADGVRTVSAGVRTNRYGAYSRGGVAFTCNVPSRPEAEPEP